VGPKLLKWFLKSFVTRLCIGLIALLFVFLLSILAGIKTGKLEIIPPADNYLSLLRNSPMFTVEGFEQMCLILLLGSGIMLVSFVLIVQYFDNQTHTATEDALEVQK